MGWFKELGAKQTIEDRDGRNHHRAFIAFCLAMLVLIGVLIAIQARRADAATICRGPISAARVAAAGTPWMGLTASRWCGSTGSGARFTTTPNWTRTYGENALWRFNKWFPNASASGTGQAPNGDTNVAYIARWSAAEFVMCVPPLPCIHSYPYGVRIWAWANGNYQVALTSTVPSLPMPRP